MVGVILAAGDGKRLKNSKNEDCCKPLIKINEKSLITYALDNLAQLKVSEAYVVVGKEGSLIRDSIGSEYENIKLHYVYQQEQKGLIDAFVQALKVIHDDENIILQLSDEVFVDLNIELIKLALETEKFDFYCGVTLEENPEKIRNNFSVETDNDSSIIRCTEKPEFVIDNIKGTGFSIFTGKTQKIIKETYELEPDKLCDLCDSFNYLVDLGYCGSTFFVARKEFNINTVLDLIEAESFLNSERKSSENDFLKICEIN
jgi:dTDP-glucose pyrophosphorylase